MKFFEYFLIFLYIFFPSIFFRGNSKKLLSQNLKNVTHNLKQLANETYFIDSLTFNSAEQISEIFDISHFFEEKINFIDFDHYDSTNANLKIRKSEINLKVNHVFNDSQSQINDFAYNINQDFFYYIVENGIKYINIDYEDNFNSTSIFDNKTVDYLYVSNKINFHSIYYIGLGSEKSIIILLSENKLYYANILDNENISDIEILENATLFDNKCNIASFEEYIFIPDKLNGLRTYKYLDSKLVPYKIFFTSNDKDTLLPKNISDITIVLNNYTYLIVADSKNGIIKSKIVILNNELFLLETSYIVERKGYIFLVNSNINKISIIVSILVNEKEEYFYQEFILLSDNDWKQNELRKLEAEVETLRCKGNYFLIIMKNMISLNKINSDELKQYLPVPNVIDGWIIQKNNNYYVIFNRNNYIAIEEIVQTKPTIYFQFPNNIQEQFNITGYSRYCVNFSDSNLSIYYNVNNFCKYICSIDINTKAYSKSEISKMVSFLIGLIAAIILITGGGIFYIYFKRYKKLTIEYQELLNMSRKINIESKFNNFIQIPLPGSKIEKENLENIEKKSSDRMNSQETQKTK